jgi:hypothetical protein
MGKKGEHVPMLAPTHPKLSLTVSHPFGVQYDRQNFV